ncbi:MAG: hypothetical protein HYX23_00870 [Candidatus Zambryskibacteria bacterium]|nr:hypothetical protein [Candidatus Zambryskibacteria bacterium]
MTNTVTTNASTGGNISSGGDAKSKAKAKGWHSDADSDANGGNGGSIKTGDASAWSEVVNVVNTNIVRVRR